MHDKGFFNLHLMNTEDHLFLHNGLRANIFSTLDAGPSCCIQNPMVNSDSCDKQQQRGFLGQCINISLKCPNVSPCFACRELDYSVGSTQKLYWINLLDNPSIPSQTQFNQILSKTSFLIYGSTCMSVMLDQELISLNKGLCFPNFAQRWGKVFWNQRARTEAADQAPKTDPRDHPWFLAQPLQRLYRVMFYWNLNLSVLNSKL